MQSVTAIHSRAGNNITSMNEHHNNVSDTVQELTAKARGNLTDSTRAGSPRTEWAWIQAAFRTGQASRCRTSTLVWPEKCSMQDGGSPSWNRTVFCAEFPLMETLLETKCQHVQESLLSGISGSGVGNRRFLWIAESDFFPG